MSLPGSSSLSGSCLRAASSLHQLRPARFVFATDHVLSRQPFCLFAALGASFFYPTFFFFLTCEWKHQRPCFWPGGRQRLATAAAANSQTLALSASVYSRLQKSTQCSRRCLQSTQARCSDSRWTESGQVVSQGLYSTWEGIWTRYFGM